MKGPADWSTYNRQCSCCGGAYHASEGGCDCWETEAERRTEELVERLAQLGCVIEGFEAETFSGFSHEDSTGYPLRRGDPTRTLYLDDHGRYAEVTLHMDTWDQVRSGLGLMLARQLTSRDPED